MANMMGEMGPNGETYEPVIRPQMSFQPEQDAETLEKAMKGMGTDEKALIGVLCNRTAEERARIAKTYKSLFGKDLPKQLKSETSGNFGKIMRYLCLDRAMLRAKILYDCIQGAGTDEQGLIEILCGATNEEIRDIKDAYQKVLEFKGKDPNRRNLEKDIENDTSGYMRRLMTIIVQAERKEPTPAQLERARREGVMSLVDMQAAQAAAQSLYDAGAGKLGTDEAVFLKVLGHESVWQLAAIDQAYEKQTGKTLRHAIKSETSGDFGTALKAMLDFSLDRPGTYATHLYKAMKGLGTRDDSLIRICITRADVDMAEIKEAYMRQYGHSLAEDIKGDTSGDYKKALLTLIGEN